MLKVVIKVFLFYVLVLFTVNFKKKNQNKIVETKEPKYQNKKNEKRKEIRHLMKGSKADQ